MGGTSFVVQHIKLLPTELASHVEELVEGPFLMHLEGRKLCHTLMGGVDKVLCY